MEEKDNLFVGLKDPKEIRRNILESSKTIVTNMQKHQSIRRIQLEKNELKKNLRDDIKEMKMLMIRVQKLFPRHISKTKKEKYALPEIKDIPDDPIQTEVDKLHKQLSLIETRLKYIE